MAALKLARLINDRGVIFDCVELTSTAVIKSWAKGRGGVYTLDIETVYNVMHGVDESTQYTIRNDRCYKLIAKNYRC